MGGELEGKEGELPRGRRRRTRAHSVDLVVLGSEFYEPGRVEMGGESVW